MQRGKNPKGRGFVYIHDSHLYHRVKTKDNALYLRCNTTVLLKLQLIMCHFFSQFNSRSEIAPHFPVLHFPPLHFWSCISESCIFSPEFSGPAFPGPAFSYRGHLDI